MKNFLRPESLNRLDDEIARLLEQMQQMETPTDEYAKLADRVKTLCQARECKNERAISSDALLAIGANVIGLLIILNFEKTGSITSKAFSWIWKK